MCHGISEGLTRKVVLPCINPLFRSIRWISRISVHYLASSLASGVALGWIGSGDPDAIIADVAAAFGKVRADTKLKESPNTLLLPVLEYNFISSTPRASNSDTTILTFLLLNIEGLNEIRPVNELIADGVIYDKNPDKLQLEVPKELEFLPPQEVGLELKVPAWGKTAGVNVYYPLSILKLTSINA